MVCYTVLNVFAFAMSALLYWYMVISAPRWNGATQWSPRNWSLDRLE
mgnify:CR=1 FL=1